MTDPKPHYVSFVELCDVTELSSPIILEIVEHGIVEPEGAEPESWLFSIQMVTATKKACRMHRDLGIDWPGIALAISLLDELEQLRIENQKLHHRLNRFIVDSDT